jgi:hypothetical protein
MKTRNSLFTACFLTALAGGMLHAQTLYTLDMTQDDTGDFRLAQIGNTFGGQGVQAAQNFAYNAVDDTYTVEARYNQDRTIVLTVPLDTPPGTDPQGFINGNVAVTLNYTYINDATNSDVVLSLRQNVGNINTGAGVNTYPNYFVRLLDNTTFELRKFTGFDATTLLDSGTLSGLVGTSNYRLEFSSINDGANVDLTASLYENNILRDTLTYSDTSAVLTAGYVGVGGGQGSTNDDTYEGINITGYTVAIPEPSSMALLAGALAGLLVMRRRRH